MVLRKKSEQLSFLHCYHHCLLIWAWLLVVKSGGCVDAYFGACCNATIHVMMYSYYALAALGFRCTWKKYLTLAQMVQFVACATQSCVVLFSPAGVCPISLPLTQLWVMLNMLFLFGRCGCVRSASCSQAPRLTPRALARFYMKRYAKPASLKTGKTA